MKRVLVTFGKYCGVAAGAMLSDWVVFLALDSMGVNHIHAQMAARVTGGLFSFIANRGWSFEAWHPSHLTRQGRRFMLLYGVSYVLSVGMLYLLVDFLGMTKYYGKVIADGACFLLNFVAMRTYVFKDRAGFTDAFAHVLTWLDKRLKPEGD